MGRTTSETDTAPDLAVPADEAHRRVDAGAVLIDVRSPGGRESSGIVVPGALLVDRTDIDGSFADAADPSIPVVVVCGSVNGSGPLARHLAGRGFDVVHVTGGAPAYTS